MRPTRYEIKMLYERTYLDQVRAWVRLHPDAFTESYPPRQVNNLYFDTREMDLLNDNLAGISERTKLRLRWYGKQCSAIQGTLELKHKANQLGWRQSCSIPATMDLTTISWSELVRQLQNHATGDIRVWLSRADQPALINQYMREYYESLDRQVRVTIDYDQAVYDQTVYAAPNLASRTPIEDQVVIEVKADASLHRRVSNVLSSFPLRAEKNSKYVRGVTGSVWVL